MNQYRWDGLLSNVKLQGAGPEVDHCSQLYFISLAIQPVLQTLLSAFCFKMVTRHLMYSILKIHGWSALTCLGNYYYTGQTWISINFFFPSLKVSQAVTSFWANTLDGMNASLSFFNDSERIPIPSLTQRFLLLQNSKHTEDMKRDIAGIQVRRKLNFIFPDLLGHTNQEKKQNYNLVKAFLNTLEVVAIWSLGGI